MPENVNTSALATGTLNEPVDDPRPTMVKVDHVSMNFNMASEQLNNLKEYAISLLKRNLFFEEFVALDDVSFEVKKGDVFGIMGTNGSGKSTILKIIAGVLDPSKGSCTVSGNIAPLIELGAGFDMDLSARENIYLNGALLGYSKEFIEDHFDDIVAFAEVEKFLDMPMKNYSSGMISRIAFAIATIIVPDILIVDEVLSVGDFMFQKKCEDRIRELIEYYGVTVLIVSHSNEQIARLCNKAIWIEKGHTRLMGDASEVTRIYGALGGRVGDEQVEHQIFEALVGSASLELDDDDKSTIVIEENANALCTKLVIDSWENDSPDTVVLACNNTHTNAVTAQAVASFYHAPVLPIERTTIPDSVWTYLYNTQPKQIIVFDCEGCVTDAMDKLYAFNWNPQVILYSGKASEHFEFSYDIYQAGLENGWWGNALAVVSFNDNPDAMACQPILYQKKAPAIFLTENDSEGLKSQVDQLKMIIGDQSQGLPDLDTLLVIGECAASILQDQDVIISNADEINSHDASEENTAKGSPLYGFAKNMTDKSIPGNVVVFGGKDQQSRFVALAQYGLDCIVSSCTCCGEQINPNPDQISDHTSQIPTGKSEVYLASLTRWPELQSVGSCVIKDQGTLLLVDETSLQSILDALIFLHSHKDKIGNLVFVGNGLLSSGLDERVFRYQLY